MDISILSLPSGHPTPAVVPVLVGPMQAFLALLPAILVAIGGTLVAMFKPSAIKRFLQLLWVQKLPVALIAVGVCGLVYAWGAVFPPAAEEAAGTAAGDPSGRARPWALWRGGPERRGWVPGSEDPVRGRVNWTFAADGIKSFYASPTVVGDRVYVTSARYDHFRDVGAINSIDADSGRRVWAFRAEKYRATFSSPAVSGNYLVVGEGLHFTNDSRVFCIDIEQSEERREGVKLWDYCTKSHVESSPCIADGRVYIGAGDDGLYCFALEPDEGGDVRLVWHLDGEEYPDCETSPVVCDGKVYFGLGGVAGRGGHAVCCVDGETGAELWRLETPYPVFSSPAIADGRLYFGMGYGDFVNTAETVAANMRDRLRKEGKSEAEIEEASRDIRPVGEVWCVDLATQKMLWRFGEGQGLGRTVLGSVAVDGDRIYFGSRDGHVYCVSTGGELIGKWDANAPIISSPAVGKDHVYVTTTTDRTGDLYGLDKRRLRLVWDVSLNSPSFSSPVVARGRVYVGTSNNGLLCAGEPEGNREKPVWRGPLGGPGRQAWRDGSLVPARGSYGWAGHVPRRPDDKRSRPTGDGNERAVKTTKSRTPPAYLDGAFYVGFDEDGAFGLVRLSRAEKLSAKPERAWFAKSAHPVYLSAAAIQTAVFFVDGRSGDEDRALRCLDPRTGEERWRHAVDSSGSGAFIITKERLFIADTAEGLTCLDIRVPTEEEEIWKVRTGPCVGVPVPVADMVVAAVKSPPRLVALDAPTGVPLWEEALPAEPQTGPVYTTGRVWVGLPAGLFGASLVASEEPCTVACGSVTGTLVCDGDRLVCVVLAARPPEGPDPPGRAGELVLIDPAAGVQKARIKDVVADSPPLLAGDVLLYLKEDAIRRYDSASGEDTHWTRIRASWPGIPVTPMIMVDSHVFFSTDKRGFICMKPKK